LILVEESWSELFLLWIIQYSISLNPIFSSVKLINDIFEIFKQLKIDPIEFICLKTIILFRFGRINKMIFLLKNKYLFL